MHLPPPAMEYTDAMFESALRLLEKHPHYEGPRLSDPLLPALTPSTGAATPSSPSTSTTDWENAVSLLKMTTLGATLRAQDEARASEFRDKTRQNATKCKAMADAFVTAHRAAIQAGETYFPLKGTDRKNAIAWDCTWTSQKNTVSTEDVVVTYTAAHAISISPTID